MFKVAYFTGYVEEDIFDDGCQPDSGFCKDLDMEFSAETLPELVAAICDWFEVDEDAIELDACETPGRIDVAVMETEEFTASEQDIARWKKGKQRLWYVVYTGFLIQQTEVSWETAE